MLDSVEMSVCGGGVDSGEPVAVRDTIVVRVTMDVFAKVSWLVRIVPGSIVDVDKADVVVVVWLGLVAIVLVELALSDGDSLKVLDGDEATPEVTEQPSMGVNSSSQPSPQ